MLDSGWQALKDEPALLVPRKSIVGLRSEQGNARETRNYYETVAESAGLNLISAEDV